MTDPEIRTDVVDQVLAIFCVLAATGRPSTPEEEAVLATATRAEGEMALRIATAERDEMRRLRAALDEDPEAAMRDPAYLALVDEREASHSPDRLLPPDAELVLDYQERWPWSCGQEADVAELTAGWTAADWALVERHWGRMFHRPQDGGP